MSDDTDRELLGLAAKALGYVSGFTDFGPNGSGPAWIHPNGERPTVLMRDFNPLTDDGDALRLAVQLHIDVLLRGPSLAQAIGNPGAVAYGEVPRGDDPYAATRRAIVIAAAALAA